MNHVPRLSEAVYFGLSKLIGTPTQLRIRREVKGIEQETRLGLYTKGVYPMYGMLTGSRGEGFRASFADQDVMFWPHNHNVICELSQISRYCIPQDTVILMECEDLKPGFTKLNLLSPTQFSAVGSSCIVISNKVYISTLIRDLIVLAVNMGSNSPHWFLHGPCCSNVLRLGDLSVYMDFAFSFHSHHWPTISLPWIQRCRTQGWPSEDVVSDILNGGFHVVPIGSTPENELEWRISFSQAELKLVFAMNHCQFLCYCLLKLFLKEVINFQSNTPVLCSYFLKTALFWVIQRNKFLIWTPNNLLSCFWECFKLLINWVRIGECPNFFIPQNNMFRHKIIGSVQSALFRQLNDLYGKGISCLLLSQSLRPYLSYAILNRTLRICTDECSIISNLDLDMTLAFELRMLNITISCIEEFIGFMGITEKLLKGQLTPYQAVTLQYLTSVVLQNTAMMIQSIGYPYNNSNKVHYKAYKVSTLLKQSCAFDFVSSILHLSMYLYRTRRFEHSLKYLQRARERILLPYIIYNTPINIDMYRRYMQGMPLCKNVKSQIRDLTLFCDYVYIDELVLEQLIIQKFAGPALVVPPLVLLHMLFILNYHKLGDTEKSHESILDLKNLMTLNDDLYVPNGLTNVSWEILGICQQTCGDYLESLQSYQNALQLQQGQVNKIQGAIMYRINTFNN